MPEATLTGRRFDRVFSEHVGCCRQAFAGWTAGDFDSLDERVRILHDALASHPGHEGPHGRAERE